MFDLFLGVMAQFWLRVLLFSIFVVLPICGIGYGLWYLAQ